MGTLVAPRSSAPALARRPERSTIARALAELSRRRREADPLSPLTPRQREIALLAAGGLENGEIAQQLWLSRRTVEFHMTNIYRTLGLSTRTQLVSLVWTGSPATARA